MLANGTCEKSGNTEEALPTVEVETVVETPVVEATQEAQEVQEVQEGLYFTFTHEGKQYEMLESVKAARLACFRDLPKRKQPEAIPAICQTYLFDEYYNAPSYSCRSHMQKTGLPAWTCE